MLFLCASGPQAHSEPAKVLTYWNEEPSDNRVHDLSSQQGIDMHQNDVSRPASGGIQIH